MKGEAALGCVGIDGQNLPANPVGSRWQLFQPDTHDARVNPGLAQIDARAVGIAHFDGAESRLQILGLGENDLAGCGWHGTSDAWLRMVEKGVGLSGCSGHDGEQGRYRKS
jgi:hypothetical protein